MRILRFSLIILIFSFNLYANSFDEAHREYLKGNYKKAVILLRKSCNKNNALACSNLAIFYYEGAKITQNLILANRYNKIGCQLGNYQSCANLAKLILEIDFSKESILTSRNLLNKACVGGYKSACDDRNILEQDYLQRSSFYE